MLDKGVADDEPAAGRLMPPSLAATSSRAFGRERVNGLAAVGDAADKETAQQARPGSVRSSRVLTRRGGAKAGHQLGHFAVNDAHDGQLGQQLPVAILDDTTPPCALFPVIEHLLGAAVGLLVALADLGFDIGSPPRPPCAAAVVQVRVIGVGLGDVRHQHFLGAVASRS